MDRRNFIITGAKAAGAVTIAGVGPLRNVARTPASSTFTVQEVIDTILREGGLAPIKDTVDTLKSGSPAQQVTAIVTTMFPTVSVIEEAARRGANFIIAHEPTFYNHRDDKEWVRNNSIVKQKQELLEKHNMAVWRFHDYCHALKPDAITYGLVRKAGWLPYYKNGQSMLTLPASSLHELVKHLKSALNIAHVRVIGDMAQPCSRIAVLPGAWGGQRQVAYVEGEKPDVLVVGEVSEWETAEYIRDGRLLGSRTALIVLGHAASEEPGMEWVAEWMQPKFPGLKITHIASGSPFFVA